MENYTTTVKPETKTELSELEQFEYKRLAGNTDRPDPKSPYTIKAAIYARVSSGPQATADKVSIPEQIEKGKEIIENNDWQLTTVYEDHKATTHETDYNDRPAMKQAVKDASIGKFDVLVIWIDSRLGRNPDETKKIRKVLKDHGVQVYSVKKPNLITDPRFFVPKRDRYNHIIEGFNDLISEADSYEFAEKMRFGKMQRAKQGFIPGKVGYGYRRKIKIYLDEGGKECTKSEVVDDLEEQEIVKQIFDLYLNGVGIRGILNILNEKGVRNRLGKLWNYSSLRYLLKNPIYAGLVRFGWRLSSSAESRQRMAKGIVGVVVKGHHTAIITEKMFIDVQNKIAERAKIGGRALGSKGLLSGRIKCPICGSSGHITSHPSSYAYKKSKEGLDKKDFSRVRFYVCSKTSKFGSKACKRYIGSQSKIDEMVVEEIKSLAKLKSTEKAFQKAIKETDSDSLSSELDVIESKLKVIPSKKEKYHIAFADSIMNYEDYGRHIKELNEEELNLSTEVEHLKGQVKDRELTKEKMETALLAFKDFYEIWDKAPFEKRKDLINTLVEKVVYSKGKLRIEYKTAN